MFLTKPSFRLEIIRLGCLTSLPLNHLLKVFALPEDKAIVCLQHKKKEEKNVRFSFVFSMVGYVCGFVLVHL